MLMPRMRENVSRILGHQLSCSHERWQPSVVNNNQAETNVHLIQGIDRARGLTGMQLIDEVFHVGQRDWVESQLGEPVWV